MLRLWLGEPSKDIARREPPPEAFPDVATLQSEWVTIVRDQRAFIETLNDEVLNAVFSFENFQGEQSEFSLADTMQHVLNHSSYHRGQVVTLLRQLGHTPPGTDFLIFLLEGRQRYENTVAPLLTEREDEIFESLVNKPGDDTFRGGLYRDGVPRPDVYLSQSVRVLFVFREPNLSNKPFDLDMRAQLRDPEFRATRDGKLLEPGSVRGWWNNQVGALAHAVVHSLTGAAPTESFKMFEASITRGERSHECLFPFGYLQIKKIGGGGVSRAADIEKHASTYRQCLKDQVALYEPHLIIGCGRGGGSPARLLHQYVLPSDDQRSTADQRFTWWRYASSARPVAMLEFNHPSFRGSREQQYCLLASAVREIATDVGLLS